MCGGKRSGGGAVKESREGEMGTKRGKVAKICLIIKNCWPVDGNKKSKQRGKFAQMSLTFQILLAIF